MSIFDLKLVLNGVNNSIQELGKEYFLLNKVTDFKYKLINNTYSIDAICNHYHVNVTINNNLIGAHQCECSQAKYKIICKHIIAVIYQLNEQLKIKMENNFKIYDSMIDRNFIDFYQTIVLLDNLFHFEFFNNYCKVQIIDKKIFTYIKNNLYTISDNLKKIYEQNKHDLTLKKAYLMIEEFKLFNQIDLDDKKMYSGNDIDTIIDIINQHQINYESFNLYQFNLKYFKLIDAKSTLFKLECEIYKTSFNYHLTTNIVLENFIYSDDFTYLLLRRNDDKLFLYKIPFCEIDQFKIIKKNLINTKNKNLINEKIQELKSMSYFNVVIKNNITNEFKQINARFYYDYKLNKIILLLDSSIVDKHWLHSIVFNKFNRINDLIEIDIKKSLIKFDNNLKFNDYLLFFKNDEYFNFIFPEYFNSNNNYDFKYDININNNAININLNNHFINNYNDFEKLKNAVDKKYKFIELSGKIFSVDNFNFNKLEEEFKRYNIKKVQWNNNIIDFKNIFLIANEINNQKIHNFINQIENEKVELLLQKNELSKLKSYQLFGVQWIKKRLNLFNGCILADEMGLGKTLQSLMLLKDFYYSNPKNSNILIITPTILLQNWINEMNKFNIDLPFVNLQCNKSERLKKIINNKNSNKVFITTYTQIVNDFTLFKEISFTYVILDEGHKIKNYQSIISKKIRSLNAKKRLILSGTPIENNLIELWTIFDFILPNFLPPLMTFRNLYYTKNKQSKNLDFLNLQTAPFILKRTKQEYLSELPKKHQYDIFVDLQENELNAYKQLIASSRKDFEKLIDKNRINLLAIITKLRMFLCYNEFEKAKYKKFLILLKEKIKNKQKIVVFCFFSTILEKISIALKTEGIDNLMIIGKTKNRWKIIDEFNKSNHCQVLLSSLKTGGIGINLTSANCVINYSPWWNESSENQAIDRTHRIGQKKDVEIYNLITNATIEIEICKIKQEKSKIINYLINDIDYLSLLNKIFYKKD